MHAIEVRDIVKRFGDFTAVDGISFAVEQGEIFGLLGPNGAGKSTLIRMLTTLIPPTAGAAIVGGVDVGSDPNGVRKVIGVIPQALTSDLELTPKENLLIFAKLYGVPRARRARLIDELLASVELTAWADKPVRNLSGGMRRRVEIARGLVHDPRIFFLDEPTTGLDPVSRTGVWEMLRRIKETRDLTVLLTTHYMDEADKLCDRIAIVDHGKLVALDSPLRLKASVPGANTVEASFGDAPPDWAARLAALPGVERMTGDARVVRLATDNGPATTTALVEAASRAGVRVLSLAVQSTSLDDVFVHYTGRQLRDALQAPTAAERLPMLNRNR
jgi:ABC-2 type transport system ATP-binding protein